MHLDVYGSTENRNYLSAFDELITIPLQIAHYLKNRLQYLFLISECYAIHRCVNFNTIIMAQIPVHKCVIHPGTEIHVLPRFNASICSEKENVFDPYSNLGNEMLMYHSTLNKYINACYWTACCIFYKTRSTDISPSVSREYSSSGTEILRGIYQHRT
jgi:hypothetical protein